MFKRRGLNGLSLVPLARRRFFWRLASRCRSSRFERFWFFDETPSPPEIVSMGEWAGRHWLRNRIGGFESDRNRRLIHGCRGSLFYRTVVPPP